MRFTVSEKRKIRILGSWMSIYVKGHRYEIYNEGLTFAFHSARQRSRHESIGI